MMHHIYFFKDKICLYGNLIRHPEHRHYLIQVVVYKESFTDRITIEIINSNTLHSMLNIKGIYFSLLFDPLSTLGKSLKEHLLNYTVKRCIIKTNDMGILAKLSETSSVEQINIMSKRILNHILDQHSIKKVLDNRINQALKLINMSNDLNMNAKAIYKEVGLSESHFNLLFKRDIGIPFRQYLLWRKLKKAILSVLQGESFTNAAQCGGFSDSAHLARTFKKNTGISLSLLIKNKRFVQVHVEDFQ